MKMRSKRMVVLELLLLTAVTCVMGMAKATSASGAPSNVGIAKHKCQSRCGNVTIPFPFGIGSNCSLDKWFEIVCNESFYPHRPFLKRTQLEVVYIPDPRDFNHKDYFSSSISYHQFQVKYPMRFFNCTGGNETRNGSFNLRGTPFELSSENTFVAVSCGVPAKVKLSSGNTYSDRGCTSKCSSSGSSTASSNYFLCNDTDCCQTSMSDTSNTYVYMEDRVLSIDTFEILFDNNYSTAASHDHGCKFAFMVDGDYWSDYKNHSRSSNEIRNKGFFPLRLIWRVNYNDSDIFHKNMSDSIDPLHYCYGGGYQNSSSVPGQQYYQPLECRCPGFRGNPYLVDGCSQDINECEEDIDYCGRGATCVNTYGGFHCSYKRKFILIGVGSATGALFLLFGVWGLYKFIKKRKDIRRKQKFFKRNGGLLLQQQISSNEGNVEKTRLFKSNELLKATANFSIDRILGQGGQGTVYKGMLEDGKIVAIKKSKVVDEAQLSEFINEVVILSQINHRNVVRLLGCCLETEVPLLVYEFIPNGTLSNYVHERNDEFPFTWKMRLQVATEVAGALSYLHSAASFPIYHRDIKSTNILLDEKYRAKVADFGTSRTISLEQTHLTTIVYGTFGYLDPEYFQSSQFTEKSDVYSFGVVLVELLTGQKAISATRSEEGRNLATYFIMMIEAENIFDIIDSQVLEDAPKDEIRQVANLAQRCLNLNGRNRPTMKAVAIELEGIQNPERATSIVQQNHEELEYVRTEFVEPWDVASTSTRLASDQTASTCTSLLQELPLLSFESR